MVSARQVSGVHVLPGCDRATTLTECSRISLNVMTLKVTSSLVNSVQGVPISVTGIAQVRNAATVADIQCGRSSLCRRLPNVCEQVDNNYAPTLGS